MTLLCRMAFALLLLAATAVTTAARAENRVCPDPRNPWLCFDLDRTTLDPDDDVVMSHVDGYGRVAIECVTSTIWYDRQYSETLPVIWGQARPVESDPYMWPIRDALCDRRGSLPNQDFLLP